MLITERTRYRVKRSQYWLGYVWGSVVFYAKVGTGRRPVFDTRLLAYNGRRAVLAFRYWVSKTI